MVRPISLRDITQGKIDPGMLSTVRINYIGSVDELEHAVPSEVVTPSPGSVSTATFTSSSALLSIMLTDIPDPSSIDF